MPRFLTILLSILIWIGCGSSVQFVKRPIPRLVLTDVTRIGPDYFRVVEFDMDSDGETDLRCYWRLSGWDFMPDSTFEFRAARFPGWIYLLRNGYYAYRCEVDYNEDGKTDTVWIDNKGQWILVWNR